MNSDDELSSANVSVLCLVTLLDCLVTPWGTLYMLVEVCEPPLKLKGDHLGGCGSHSSVVASVVNWEVPVLLLSLYSWLTRVKKLWCSIVQFQ